MTLKWLANAHARDAERIIKAMGEHRIVELMRGEPRAGVGESLLELREAGWVGVYEVVS